LRSARRRFAAETVARSAAEKERAFYNALIDQLPLGIIMAEAPSGKILHINHWARRMLARIDPRAADSRTVQDFAQWPITDGDGKDLRLQLTPLSRALQGEVLVGEEIRFGERRVYSVTAGPIRDESGQIIAAVSGFSDVTAKKHAERERELFIGALGHDLRNPLNAITLSAESLSRRSDLPGDAGRQANRMAHSARRMNQLIGDLLDFARSQYGAIRLNPEPCRLKDLADEVAGDLRATHPGREIRVETDGGCNGRWDRARLSQVLSNLIGNALVHGAPDRPVEVLTGGDGGYSWARIGNHGPSIPPEELHHIFEPFHTGGKSGGTGLGLYIARSIVEAHGGTIEVESHGGYTRFTFRLPHDPPSQTTLQA
jgi:signal transduction histidine kinase